jgi:hypothetical protein
MPADDGSVRIVCDGTDLPRFDNDLSDVRAFAFDMDGRLMPGWPITLRPGPVARVVGRSLVLVESQILTDVVATGVVSYEVWLTTVSADGVVSSGTRAPMVETCCGGRWTIGPDGVAYGVESVGEWLEAGDETSQIMALDGDGVPDGWPVEFDGTGSAAGFGPDGRPLVATGPFASDSSRVLAFGTDGVGASASGDLPILVVRGVGPGDVDCAPPKPLAPITSDDGTIFVFSELDDRVLALDAELGVKTGWPFEPDTPIVRPYFAPPGSEVACSTFTIPVAGPTGMLFLSLQAPNETVGGRLVAVGPDGQVRPGWPVRLNRPGAEFWSVVVGSDGTAYALALEPETGETSSASLLAIAPDSTVLSITTIVEP